MKLYICNDGKTWAHIQFDCACGMCIWLSTFDQLSDWTRWNYAAVSISIWNFADEMFIQMKLLRLENVRCATIWTITKSNEC